MAGPLGRSIAETRDADPARQSPLDGSLHELGGEERERDRQIDLSNAAATLRYYVHEFATVLTSLAAARGTSGRGEAWLPVRVMARIESSTASLFNRPAMSASGQTGH